MEDVGGGMDGGRQDEFLCLAGIGDDDGDAIDEVVIVHALMSGEISIEEFLEWCEANIPNCGAKIEEVEEDE